METLPPIETMMQTGTSWSMVGDVPFLSKLPRTAFSEGVYGQAVGSKEPVVVGDLKKIKEPSEIDQILIKKGFRSLLLAPLFDRDGKILGAFRVGF